MGIIATGSKTIIDLSDGKSLSAYLGSNQPRIQILDVNSGVYAPDWTTAQGKLIITPVIYANQNPIALNNSALSIIWKRKEGTGSETSLAAGETVSGNLLTVNQNKLSTITSGLITYIAAVTYIDPDTTMPINATTEVSIALVRTGINGTDGTNGKDGKDGTNGADAVVFSLYAPQGTVFTNGLNPTGGATLTIQAAAYKGATAVTSPISWTWSKYASGSWATITGSTSSLTVNAADVVGMATYRCQMVLNGVTYTDIITLIDKTDNYQAVIDSSAGDVFKNAVGESVLSCRLWQNGTEVDVLKSTTFSVTDPSGPSAGTMYYRITKTTPVMKLLRYSGTAWVDETNNAAYKHTRTYKWYRRDASGNPLDSGAVFATGKTIFIDGDDVDNKTVFVCEVE